MKRYLFLILVFSFSCFIAWSQTNFTGELIEFRIQEQNYTRSFSLNVQITTSTRGGVKYLDIALTPLDNSVGFSSGTVGWNLYNDSNDNVSWKYSGDRNYIQIANYVFFEDTSIGKKLYLFQDGMNSGRYNTNIVIILLPDSFSL